MARPTWFEDLQTLDAIALLDDARARAAEHRREGIRALVAEGNHYRALLCFAQALTEDPADADTLAHIALIVEERGEDVLRRKAAWAAVIAIDPANALANQHLARLYGATHD